jgi:hypothetical protein
MEATNLGFNNLVLLFAGVVDSQVGKSYQKTHKESSGVVLASMYVRNIERIVDFYTFWNYF